MTPGNSTTVGLSVVLAGPARLRDRRDRPRSAAGSCGSSSTAGADVVVPGPRLGASLGARRVDGLIEQVRVVRGDVRDQETIERALGEYEIATVFHLAAQTTVGVANRNPVSTLDTNIRGTWALLEACRRTPDRSADRHRLVRQGVRRSGRSCRTRRTRRCSGRHPYDVSKSCADLLAQMYAKSYDLPVCVTRCGNFYGGGDLNWNRIVPGTIRSVLRGERPVIRSDGQFTRDYLYVEDGARAYMLLAEQLAARPELARRRVQLLLRASDDGAGAGRTRFSR